MTCTYSNNTVDSMTTVQELENKDEASWTAIWKDWKPSCVCTVCYILDGKGNVLLIRRKKDGFGSGKVSAPGGHLELGETVEHCCIRETFEEVGLIVEDPIHVGLLNFKIPGNDMEGHVYIATKFSGVLKESEEAQPFWNPVEDLPFDRMFSDDAVWLSHALNGECFVLDAPCDEDGTMLSYRFRLCKSSECFGRFGNNGPVLKI